MPFRCFLCKIFLQQKLQSRVWTLLIFFFHLTMFTPTHLFGTTYMSIGFPVYSEIQSSFMAETVYFGYTYLNLKLQNWSHQFFWTIDHILLEHHMALIIQTIIQSRPHWTFFCVSRCINNDDSDFLATNFFLKRQTKRKKIQALTTCIHSKSAKLQSIHSRT